MRQDCFHKTNHNFMMRSVTIHLKIRVKVDNIYPNSALKNITTSIQMTNQFSLVLNYSSSTPDVSAYNNSLNHNFTIR